MQAGPTTCGGVRVSLRSQRGRWATQVLEKETKDRAWGGGGWGVWEPEAQ